MKYKKIHVAVLVFGLFWPKSFGIIYAQVPFLATQAIIRYRQFLYIAGTGIADAQVRIT